MNFSLLLPSALVALLALAIPVLIHLSRRSEHKLTEFAAMRWLKAHLRPQRKWLLQERLLLATRLLLLIVIALFLAQPILKTNGTTEHWVVVVPGANTADIVKPPSGKNVQWHWLSAGFPTFDKPITSTPIPFSSLLRELDSQLPASTKLTVVMPDKLAGLDGQRIVLSRPVGWLITSGTMKQVTYTLANKSIQLAIRYDAKHTENLKYFRALQSIWRSENKQKNQKDQAIDLTELSNTPPDKGKVLVWLASGELPKTITQWVQDGGILLATNEVKIRGFDDAVPVWQDAEHGVILRAKNQGQGRLLQWQSPLTPSEMPVLLDAEFPDKLLSVIGPDPMPPAIDFAKQQMPEQAVMKWSTKPDSISSWFIGLILLLFALERLLATRKQSWAS